MSPGEIEAFVAKRAIANVLAVHSRGVDRADVNLLASAYHCDATVDYGFFNGPAHELAALLAASQKGRPVSSHYTSNRLVQVEGERAYSESYVVAYMEHPEGGEPFQRLIGGRYLDRHERRQEGWRIAHRRFVMDWNMNRPGTPGWLEPPADMAHFVPRGTHGQMDPGRALLTVGAARLSRQSDASGAQRGEFMASTSSQGELDAALSRQKLEELCAAYARGLDRADPLLLASLFHPGATVVSGIVNGPAEAFAGQICEFLTKNLERCFHSVSNSWFEVQGDRAIGEIYVLAMTGGGGNDTLTGGRYLDSYERRAGQWKFTSRTFVLDWTATQPTSFQSQGLYASFQARGCFGSQDPVYAFWKTQARGA